MRPPNVPSDPDATYKQTLDKDGGWQGWGHWLGTGKQRTKELLLFKEALAVARSLNLASSTEWNEWNEWSKEGMRPPNVPSRPGKVHEDHGWPG